MSDETIRKARLGWTPKVSIPTKDGARYWQVSGIVIPWLERDRLGLVKISRRTGEEPKYAEAFRDRPSIFPAPSVIRPSKPLVIVEGEFDALLLGQGLGEQAAVVTLGSASAGTEGAIYLAMLPAPVWYLAHDADPAGDRAASGWPARAVNVRPPTPHKDWGEVHAARLNLIRYVWHRILATPTPWEELARERWGAGSD